MIPISDDHIRRVGESIDDFMIRLAENMNAYGLRWQGIADILNAESGEVFSESRWRKRFKTFNQGRMYERKRSGNDLLLAQARELEKQKIGLAEQRSLFKAEVRAEAKRDLLFQEIKDAFDHFDPISLRTPDSIHLGGDGTLLVVVSDWHIGIAFNSEFGSYDSDIARCRIERYALRVVGEAALLCTSRCIVALAGDLTAGGIHQTLRVENRENGIQQIKTASELLAQFLSMIACAFDQIDVYGVGGNHSRLFAKDDALIGELLDNLLPWYVEARLQGFENIHFHFNGDCAAVSVFNVEGHRVALVHGDHDSMDEKGVAKLESLLGKHIEIIVCGHLHENAFFDVLKVHVVRGGCLSGSGDDYTLKGRLSCDPSQMMAHITAEDGVAHLIPVYFR